MAEKEKKQSVQTIQTKTRVEKGKSSIASVIFGRTGIIILLILLQFGFLIAGYTYLQGKMYFIDSVVKAGAVILVIYLTNNRSNPAFKMVWMTIMLVAPVFGVLLYIFVEFQVGVRWLNARLEHMHETTKKHWTQDEAVQEQLKEEDSEVASLAHYVCEYGGFPAYENTGVKYFSCGEDKIEELIRQLEKAEKFIFMEYFIIGEGYVWDTVLEVLRKKVKEGVEVRFLYDGMCCLSLLPYHYPQELESYGIQCHMFAPIVPALSTRQNNRDHRKIVVIDGKVAFTGGINLADEYINAITRFGYWKDAGLRIEGAAAWNFTVMFLDFWNAFRPFEQDYSAFRPQLAVLPASDGVVQPYADSPLDEEPVAETVYLDILAQSQQYVYFYTPYLAIGEEMLDALRNAAKRGVDVRLVLPGIPDKKLVFRLSRSYYLPLLRAGVRIYEYTPGFLHAKCCVSDDRAAVVGSINMDYRSMFLHFECGVLLLQNSQVLALRDDVRRTLPQCREVQCADCRTGLAGTVLDSVLRLLSPLM